MFDLQTIIGLQASRRAIREHFEDMPVRHGPTRTAGEPTFTWRWPFVRQSPKPERAATREPAAVR